MNLTRIYPGGMFEPPDKYLHGNPLGPRAGRQLLPWAKSDQAGANPLLAESGQPSLKYDLDKWDPAYFERLRAFVGLAGKKDIIVEIPFFNGMYADCWPLMPMYHTNNIQNIGYYDVKDCGLYTTTDSRNQEIIKYQKAYIKKIVTELNGYDNLIYDICDEPSLQGLPDGSIIVNPDSVIIPWINEMKDAFIQTEGSLPKKHLLGQTVQNVVPSGALSAGIYNKNKQYAIYLFHASPDKEWGSSFVPDPGKYTDSLTINDIGPGSYIAEWIDPVTGIVKSSEKINHKGGNLKLTTPGYSLDIVLRINKTR